MGACEVSKVRILMLNISALKALIFYISNLNSRNFAFELSLPVFMYKRRRVPSGGGGIVVDSIVPW